MIYRKRFRQRICQYVLVSGLGLWVLAGCTVSFSGASIAPDINTYYVELFKNNAQNAPAGLAQICTEKLREKIRVESRLVYADQDPHITYRGTVQDFSVSAQAPQQGTGATSVAAFNRLTISVAIEFINQKDETKNWKNTFSFFYDFPNDANLIDVQDKGIDDILARINEDIFNKSFADW